MADTSELAYLYARVCGAFSTMKLAARGAELAREGTLSSLWGLYFGAELPNKPESWLLAELERKAMAESIRRFMDRAAPFLESNVFIKALVAKYEYSAVKAMLYNLAASKPKSESLSFSDPLIQGALESWPRLADMFGGTEYAWINAASLVDMGETQNRLDRQYYAQVWEKLQTLPAKRRGGIPDLLVKEMAYLNLVWALRLRRYYGYSKEKVLPLLIAVKGKDLSSMALGSFDIDIDNLDSVGSWPQRRLLEGQGGPRLDLPALEAKVLGEIFAAVRRALHVYPEGYTPLYCYFKLLDTELSTVLGVIEGLRLKVSAEEKEHLAWVLAGEGA